jgi:hypothetical protein
MRVSPVNVRYVPEALAEYEAAAAWYDDHSSGGTSREPCCRATHEPR